MPAGSFVSTAHWPAVGLGGRIRRPLSEGAVGLLVAGATVGAVTYAPVPRVLIVGLAALLLLALVVWASSWVAATLLGVSIPEIQDVTGGHLGVHVAASDVVLVLIGARVMTNAAVRQRLPAAIRALRPVAFPLVQYAWLIGVLLVIHLSFGSAAKSLQRLELFALPVLVGAYVALRGRHMTVLRAYVVAATILAVAWPVLNPTGVLGTEFDKNPVGGFIATAILLLLTVRGLRRLLWCIPVLLVGLGLSASRGAILGLVVGIVTIAIMHRGASRRAVFVGTLALLVTGLVIFQFLPASTTARLTNLSSTGNSSSSWAIYYRTQYYRDAELVIAAHPLTGVGVGNYVSGSAANRTFNTDPHQVILLEAAEGGYLFAASFILLFLGTTRALWRLRHLELAAVAAGVLLATLAHGMVDVYWVRGTPVLGWLLVGMVCGLSVPRTVGGAAA
jgi:O-Antigen ligase